MFDGVEAADLGKRSSADFFVRSAHSSNASGRLFTTGGPSSCRRLFRLWRGRNDGHNAYRNRFPGKASVDRFVYLAAAGGEQNAVFAGHADDRRQMNAGE